MSNPFYSIGSRLIDEQGKAATCAIQIVDDSFVLNTNVNCLASVACKKSLQVDGTLTVTQQTTTPTSIDISKAQVGFPTNFPDVTANSIVVGKQDHTETYFTAKKGEGEGENEIPDFVFFNPSDEGLKFTSASSSTNLLRLNLDSLIFGNTSLGVNLYLSFLFDQSVLGSLWLLRLNPSSSSSANYSWLSGASIAYSNNQWSISGNTTAGTQTRTLSSVYHCGIYHRDYSDLGVDTGTSVSPSTSYKFISLTPSYATLSRSYLTLAMRIA